MRISIDVNDLEPVFAQLIGQIRAGVQRGELKPGAPLPPIRQLAGDLQINPNTVAKAYSLLERDGVTINAVGKLTRNPSHHPLSHDNGKERLNPWLASTIAAGTAPLIAIDTSAAAKRSIHREDRIATTFGLRAEL